MISVLATIIVVLTMVESALNWIRYQTVALSHIAIIICDILIGVYQ